MSDCLAIFAHPDDEVLGCGGVLAQHAALGDAVRLLLLSTGLTARGPAGAREIETLRDDSRKAADILGIDEIEFGDFPDNRMDSVPFLDVIQRVEAFVGNFDAPTVYTHFGGDLNIDHQMTERAVMTACRPLPGRPPQTILACEVNSSTEWSSASGSGFQPTEFVDISDALAAKLSALACYRSELRAWPHPRSLEGVKALARWRGSHVGVDAAEAFLTLRRVRRGAASRLDGE